MKRYLIYGFLTILIITLNFAFIIVLATDNVRINYRVLFLLWIVVILAAAGLAYLEKTKKNKEAAAAATATAATKNNLARPTGESGFSNLYKNKCIKKFKLTLAEELTNKVEAGFFGGYVNNEEYANENVQAVYTNQDQLLGYINNKKKKKLCQNIEVLYDEPIVCWGEISWDDSEKRFCVKGHLPILYSEPEINRFKKLVKLKEELLQIEATPEIADNNSYLEKIENFYYLQQSEITPSSLDHPVQPQILPEMSKNLYEKREWEELVRLKKYPILISRMKQPEKKEVLSRIKKGEKKMSA